MDYIIHTFGGGDILAQVFNGIGRIFHTNSEYFTPMGKFALTIGGVWAGTRAIFNGNIGVFAKEWFFPSFLILVFLFTPKANVWIKDEVALNAPVKVDNIPIGVAFFSSISSRISYSLSELLEKHLLPADDGLASRKTGIMFGAKAVGKMRDVQIQDAVTLSNSKEFFRQCFTKPYLVGNILGKKAAAQRTNDILGFIKENIPNNFGIYYKEPTSGAISFKTCSQSLPLIETAIKKEIDNSLLAKFATSIGIQGEEPVFLIKRLKAVTGDTLKYLKKEQTDIHEWMKQAMILNANREAYDDWREKHSLGRIYPQLVSMNATRGMFQQSFSYLVAGEIAANTLPILQSVFFALVICLIFIVFPMSMLPGGYNIFKTWCMLMIWVGSWSMFFTIIHCLGMISLSGKSTSFGDMCMSILSQGGFSELTLNSFATFQLLAASVPMLAWAVLKGCAQATTALAGHFSPISLASSIGANIADNNISMDNYNFGNRSISQQNLAPLLQMGGGIISDGNIRVESSDSGRQFITESVDNLSTNFRVSDLESDSSRIQLTDTQSRITGLSNRASELSSQEERQTQALSHRFAHSDAMIKGLSISENIAIKEALSKGESVSSNYSNSERKDTSTNTSASIGVNFGGIGASTGVNAVTSNSVSHDSAASEHMSYNEAQELVLSASRDGRINTSDDEMKSLSKDISSTWNEQQSIGVEISRAEQTAAALQREIGYIRSNSATIDHNMNDQVLQKIIDTHPDINSKEQAVRWIQTHGMEAGNIAREIIDPANKLGSANINNVESQAQSLSDIHSNVSDAYSNTPTKAELKSKYDENAEKLAESSIGSSATAGIKSLTQDTENNVNLGQKMYNTGYPEGTSLQNLKGTITENKNKIKKEFDNTGKSTVIRTLDRIGQNEKEIESNVGEQISGIVKNIVGNSE